MLIIPQDPSDNDTEDGGKTITPAQALSLSLSLSLSLLHRGVGLSRGGYGEERGGRGGLREPSSRGPTSWLIKPIKSPESIGAPGASSLFLPRTACNNRKCNDSCSPSCVWIVLSSPSCRLARRTGQDRMSAEAG